MWYVCRASICFLVYNTGFADMSETKLIKSSITIRLVDNVFPDIWWKKPISKLPPCLLRHPSPPSSPNCIVGENPFWDRILINFAFLPFCFQETHIYSTIIQHCANFFLNILWKSSSAKLRLKLANNLQMVTFSYQLIKIIDWFVNILILWCRIFIQILW